MGMCLTINRLQTKDRNNQQNFNISDYQLVMEIVAIFRRFSQNSTIRQRINIFNVCLQIEELSISLIIT